MFYLKNDRHLKLLYGIAVLIKKRTMICLSMLFHCLPKRGQLGDTHVQVIYVFRQRYVSAILLSILLLSRHSNRPITMVHPTTMVTIVMPKTIHRQTCPVCFLRSILLLIFYNSTTFWYDLICLNWQSYGWNVTIKNFRSIYNNFYGIINFRVFLIRCGRYKKVLHVKAIRFTRQASMHLTEEPKIL